MCEREGEERGSKQTLNTEEKVDKKRKRRRIERGEKRERGEVTKGGKAVCRRAKKKEAQEGEEHCRSAGVGGSQSG